MSEMSAAARAAIDRALSTELDVARTPVGAFTVATSYDAVYGAYLTSVLGSAADLGLQDDERWSQTRPQAVEAHNAMVADVRAVLGVTA